MDLNALKPKTEDQKIVDTLVKKKEENKDEKSPEDIEEEKKSQLNL
jgi:hypothetical protein